MKRVLSIFILICFFAQGYSQFGVKSALGAPNTLTNIKGGAIADSGWIIPPFTDTSAAVKVKYYAGALIRVNNQFYYRDSAAVKWIPLGSTFIVDTTDYAPVIDSTGNYSFRILYAQGNKIVGSANMTYDTAINEIIVTRVNSQVGLFDSLNITEPPPVVSSYDPTTDPDNYILLWDATTGQIKQADWAGGGGGGSGTVTSVATNTATGITGGTITTSGTLAIDTNIISTRAWRDKLADSLGALIKDTAGLGNLYIRNTTTQEDKRFNVRAGRLDSLLASGSGGLNIYSNSGTHVMQIGAGGGAQTTHFGFAGYNSDLSGSYTDRSFIDRGFANSNYARLSSHNFFTTRNNFQGLSVNKDSVPISTTNLWVLTLDTTTNRLQRRSATLLGVKNVGTIQTTATANGASISNDTLYLHAASATTGGVITTAQQDWAGKKLFAGGVATNTIENRSSGSAVTITAEQSSGETNGSIRLVGSNYTTNTAGRAIVSINGTFAQTSVSGNNRALLLQPVWNMTGTSTHDAIGIDYNPTVTSVFGQHYGMLIRAGRVGIGTATPNASALVDMSSTTQGFLMPRMTASQRGAISSPATGLQVYDTDSLDVFTYNGTRWFPSRLTDYANSTLGSPVTMTTAGTFYTGATIVLPAGTWLLTGQIAFTVPGAAGTHTIEGRIHNGSAAVASGHFVVPASGNRPASLSFNTAVVITGNTTYTLDLTSNVNNGQINAVTVTSSQAAATQLTAVRLR